MCLLCRCTKRPGEPMNSYVAASQTQSISKKHLATTPAYSATRALHSRVLHTMFMRRLITMFLLLAVRATIAS